MTGKALQTLACAAASTLLVVAAIFFTLDAHVAEDLTRWGALSLSGGLFCAWRALELAARPLFAFRDPGPPTYHQRSLEDLPPGAVYWLANSAGPYVRKISDAEGLPETAAVYWQRPGPSLAEILEDPTAPPSTG